MGHDQNPFAPHDVQGAFHTIEIVPANNRKVMDPSIIQSQTEAAKVCNAVREYLPNATSTKISKTILKDVSFDNIDSGLKAIFDPNPKTQSTTDVKPSNSDSLKPSTLYSLFKKLFGTTTQAEDTDECDHDDHKHFTLFSLWSAEFGELIRASFLTLRLRLSGQLATYRTTENTNNENGKPKTKTVPLWFAFSSLLIFPIVLLPLLYLVHHLLSQIFDLTKSWWHTVRGHEGKTQVKSWVKWIVPLFLFLPIIVLPIFFTRNFLYTKPINGNNRERFPVARGLARLLIFFASLGTGFIAVTAVMASPLGISIGAAVWLFFIAGFLSEWQTLELSLYDLLKQLFTHKDFGLKEEIRKKITKKLNRDWGIKQKNKLLDFEQWKKLYPEGKLEREASRLHWMQMAAFTFSIVIGAGIFALAFSHSEAALAMLFGSMMAAAHPVGLTVILAIIAVSTSIAYFCLVYRGLREAIYNPYGDHLIGAWIKALHKLFEQNTAKGKSSWHIIKPIFMTLLAIGMTFLAVFYIMTAGPAWYKAAVHLYNSKPFSIFLDVVYYPVMFVFYSSVSKKAADAIVTLGVELWNSLKRISQTSFASYKEAMGKCDWWTTKILIGAFGILETLLKSVCFIVLDFGLTLGLFLLHLVGDAAIGSEEGAPAGFSEHTVLALNSLSHFFADFSFILEWANGDLNHADHHHHDDNPVAPYHVSIPYALACLTLIVPLAHYALHKWFPKHIRPPLQWLMTNKLDVENDLRHEKVVPENLETLKALNSKASPENNVKQQEPSDDQDDHHHEDSHCHHAQPCNWLRFVRGEKPAFTLFECKAGSTAAIQSP